MKAATKACLQQHWAWYRKIVELIGRVKWRTIGTEATLQQPWTTRIANHVARWVRPRNHQDWCRERRNTRETRERENPGYGSRDLYTMPGLRSPKLGTRGPETPNHDSNPESATSQPTIGFRARDAGRTRERDPGTRNPREPSVPTISRSMGNRRKPRGPSPTRQGTRRRDAGSAERNQGTPLITDPRSPRDGPGESPSRPTEPWGTSNRNTGWDLPRLNPLLPNKWEVRGLIQLFTIREGVRVPLSSILPHASRNGCVTSRWETRVSRMKAVLTLYGQVVKAKLGTPRVTAEEKRRIAATQVPQRRERDNIRAVRTRIRRYVPAPSAAEQKALIDEDPNLVTSGPAWNQDPERYYSGPADDATWTTDPRAQGFRERPTLVRIRRDAYDAFVALLATTTGARDPIPLLRDGL